MRVISEKAISFNDSHFPILSCGRNFSASDYKSRGCKFESQPGHINFMEIDLETIATAIFSLPLIQEWLLSATRENMCTYRNVPKHTYQIPRWGKNLMVFPSILWSYYGGCRSHRFWKKKIFFLISGTFDSFWDIAAGNKPILWEGMIWVGWHVSKLTPSQVSFC